MNQREMMERLLHALIQLGKLSLLPSVDGSRVLLIKEIAVLRLTIEAWVLCQSLACYGIGDPRSRDNEISILSLKRQAVLQRLDAMDDAVMLIHLSFSVLKTSSLLANAVLLDAMSFASWMSGGLGVWIEDVERQRGVLAEISGLNRQVNMLLQGFFIERVMSNLNDLACAHLVPFAMVGAVYTINVLDCLHAFASGHSVFGAQTQAMDGFLASVGLFAFLSFSMRWMQLGEEDVASASESIDSVNLDEEALGDASAWSPWQDGWSATFQSVAFLAIASSLVPEQIRSPVDPAWMIRWGATLGASLILAPLMKLEAVIWLDRPSTRPRVRAFVEVRVDRREPQLEH